MADIKRLFTPEFRNRLDAIISFGALRTRTSSCAWSTSSCCSSRASWRRRRSRSLFSDALRKHLAEKGFDPLMGARPMQRLIQDTIRRALADELLFGRLVDGGRLSVDVDDKGEVQLDIAPNKKDKPKSEPATAD